MSLKGKFIVFEGVDHSGKSTVSNLVVQKLKENKDLTIYATREPGGTGIEICEDIRYMLLNKYPSMDPKTEAYLYAASRAEHVKEIKKRLKEGQTVICDRYFYSSLVYQGIARKLGVNHIFDLNQMAIDDLYPDIVFFVNISLDTYKQRRNKIETPDRIEKEDVKFFETILNNYLEVLNLASNKSTIYDLKTDSSTPEETVSQIMKLLQKY